jgi:hypothetical protein
MLILPETWQLNDIIYLLSGPHKMDIWGSPRLSNFKTPRLCRGYSEASLVK